MGKLDADNLLAPSKKFTDILAATHMYIDASSGGFIRADGGATAQFVVNERSFIIRHTAATSQENVTLTVGTGEVTGHRGPRTLRAGETASIDIVDRIMHVSLHDNAASRIDARISETGYTVTTADAGMQFWSNSPSVVNLPLPPGGATGFFPAPIWFWPQGGGVFTFTPLDGTTLIGPSVVDVAVGPVRLDFFWNQWFVEPWKAPAVALDAASKQYVDAAIAALRTELGLP
jgi:hypothetical protein